MRDKGKFYGFYIFPDMGKKIEIGLVMDEDTSEIGAKEVKIKVSKPFRYFFVRSEAKAWTPPKQIFIQSNRTLLEVQK